MPKLKRCPCGAIPEGLHIAPGDTSKYAWVSGLCCTEWSIEFRTHYADISSADCMDYAVEAWNGSPRAGIKEG